jgi:competence protein ComEC
MQLCITPSDLFSPGFLLSYSAVLGILLYSPPLLHRVKVRNSAARWLRDVAVVSVAAQIGVLPVMLCVFGTLPTYFLPANIVAGLLGTWALGVGFLLLLLADVPGLAGALGFAFDWLLFLLHQVANFFANLPGAVIAGLAIPTWAGVLMALGIFALGIGLQKRKPLNEDAHLRRLGLL